VNHVLLLLATSLGWVGAVSTVGAYALVSRRRLDATSMRFQLINVAGAGLLAVSASSAGNWPSLVSNLVWAGIGLHTLVRSRHALAAAAVERWCSMRAPRDVRHLPVRRIDPVTDPEAAARADDVAAAA
jgi:hypothetical protein